MEDHMQSTVVQKRGKIWPILLLVVCASNLADYFYKSSYQPHDLLQGLGFLIGAFWLYFDPASLTTKSNVEPPLKPAIRVIGMFGVALLIAGLVFEWL